MVVKSRRSTWKSSAGEGNPARTQSPATGRIRGEGSQGTGLAYILVFYAAPRILVTKPPRATTSARPWRIFDTPKVLPFCSAKHSGVNSPDAEQRPPERGAICNPTTCETSNRLLKYSLPLAQEHLPRPSRVSCARFPYPETQCFRSAFLPFPARFLAPFPSHLPLQTDLPQAAQSREVLARHRQHKQLINLLDPAHHHLTHVPHRLGPAKALFDQLSLLLGDGVAFAARDPVRHRRLTP